MYKRQGPNHPDNQGLGLYTPHFILVIIQEEKEVHVLGLYFQTIGFSLHWIFSPQKRVDIIFRPKVVKIPLEKGLLTSAGSVI